MTDEEVIRQIENTEVHQESDNVNHPSHYTRGNVECIDAIKAAIIGLEPQEAIFVKDIIKYVWRYKYKNGLEDLKKAMVNLDWLIDEVSKNEVTKP